MVSLSIHETCSVFRILVKSISEPGRLCTFDSCGIESDLPLIYQLCNTLLDNEVSFSVIGKIVEESFINSITVLCGALYTDVDNAQYVVVYGGNSYGYLQNVSRGCLEYPDTVATVIYCVDDLGQEKKIKLRLTGPGIERERIIGLGGVPLSEIEMINAMNSDFPLGIDVIFCDKSSVLSIPRSTKLEILKD